MSESPDESLEEAIAYLHGNLGGLIGFDGDVRSIKIIVAPDGFIAAPVMVAMLRAIDTNLFLPDEDPTSIHLNVTLEQFEESDPYGPLADRWRIYHGEPPDVRWARMSIDAARHNGLFIDGEALMRPNALVMQEAALCKILNGKHTDLLRRACLASRKIGIEQPIAVGVDPFGIDVRGTFGITRLDSPIVLCNETDLLAALRELAG